MSEKHQKWKDVGRPSHLLEKTLFQRRELPVKFAPASKDRSKSVDALFNSSRSRINSSTDMIALNQSKEQASQELLPQRKEDPLPDKKASLLKFPTLSLVGQQSSFTDGRIQPSVILTDLKKEFWSFRQNVLNELERQKSMVQKFVKEVILTLEVELEKVRRRTEISTNNGEVVSNTLNNIEAIPAKSIQQWKSSLSAVRLASNTPTNLKEPTTVPIVVGKPNRQEVILTPPQPPLDPTALFNGLEKLKGQLSQVQRLLEGRRDEFER